VRRRQSGNALVEFTLVGIPIIFVLIATFEMSRGMWLYQTLAHAAKEGARYVVVRGENCVYNNNNCPLTIGELATTIEQASLGLPADKLTVTITSNTRTYTGQLSQFLNDGTYWPTYAKGAGTYDDGARVGQQITVTLVFPFESALAMFWPGAGGSIIPTVTLPASSTEVIEF